MKIPFSLEHLAPLDEYFKNTLRHQVIDNILPLKRYEIYKHLESTAFLYKKYSSLHITKSSFLTSLFTNIWHSIANMKIIEGNISKNLKDKYKSLIDSFTQIVKSLQPNSKLIYNPESYKNASRAIDGIYKLLQEIEFSKENKAQNDVVSFEEYFNYLIVDLNLLKELLILLFSIQKAVNSTLTVPFEYNSIAEYAKKH